MPDQFEPTFGNAERGLHHSLVSGGILFMLSINGMEEWSLVSRFFNAHHEHAGADIRSPPDMVRFEHSGYDPDRHATDDIAGPESLSGKDRSPSLRSPGR